MVPTWSLPSNAEIPQVSSSSVERIKSTRKLIRCPHVIRMFVQEKLKVIGLFNYLTGAHPFRSSFHFNSNCPQSYEECPEYSKNHKGDEDGCGFKAPSRGGQNELPFFLLPVV